jgi:hypothetical protein
MGKRSGPREPLSLASFERALEEEMSVSAEFDLPLTLMVVRVGGVLDAETTLRLLDTLRAADLVAIPSASELAVVLPNTTPDGAGALERRVRRVLPEAGIGLSVYEPNDEFSGLLGRARVAADTQNP